VYCQSCSAEIQPALNYCNRCGAQVAALAAQDERVVFVPADVSGPVRWLAATICLTLLIGFTILFTAVGHLAGRGITGDPLIALIVLGLAGIFTTEFLLIRMMSRLLFESGEQARPAAAGKSKPNELRPAAAQRLSPASVTTGPMHSVTDHTTRTLAEAYREPRA
jgi:hypothetical protein